MLLLRVWMNLLYGIHGGRTEMFTFHLFWISHIFQVKSHKIILYVNYFSGLGISFVILITQIIKLNWPLITLVSTDVAFPVMSFLLSRCTKSFWQLTCNSETSAAWFEHNFLVVSTQKLWNYIEEHIDFTCKLLLQTECFQRCDTQKNILWVTSVNFNHISSVCQSHLSHLT